MGYLTEIFLKGHVTIDHPYPSVWRRLQPNTACCMYRHATDNAMIKP